MHENTYDSYMIAYYYEYHAFILWKSKHVKVNHVDGFKFIIKSFCVHVYVFIVSETMLLMGEYVLRFTRTLKIIKLLLSQILASLNKQQRNQSGT